MTQKQEIELTESNKFERREIKKDCRVLWGIIEDTSCTRKWRNEISKGPKIIIKLTDSKGKVITIRDTIIRETTKY